LQGKRIDLTNSLEKGRLKTPASAQPKHKPAPPKSGKPTTSHHAKDHPMTETEIRAFLFDILENMFEIDTGNVTGSTNLYEDLEIDSIDAIDLLDQIKRQTGYKLQAEDFRNVRTIDDIIAAVSKLYQDAKPEA